MIRLNNFKVSLITFILTGFTLTSFAQIAGGGRIGVNFSNLRGSSVNNNSMLTGYNIGGYINHGAEEILKGDIAEILSLQVELLIESKGATMDYPKTNPLDTINKNNTIPSKMNLTYVTIPILAKFNFGDKKGLNYFAIAGFFGAGLFGVTVEGKKMYDQDLDENTDRRNFRDDFDGFDIGMVFGGGASIPFGGRKSPWRAIGDVRYSLGLSNIGEKRDGTPDVLTDYLSEIKTGTISLTFGVLYKF